MVSRLTVTFTLFILCLVGSIHAQFDYGITVDAGRVTKVYVYRWPSRSSLNPLASNVRYSVSQQQYFALSTGLAAVYSTNKTQVSNHLTQIVNGITSVPDASKSNTTLFVRGSDDFRNLPASNQTDLIGLIRTFFKTSGYKFQDSNVGVLTFQQQAAHGWLAANYLSQTLGSSTFGTIEVRSNSVVIAFASPKAGKSAYSLYVISTPFTLYAQGTDNIGNVAAWNTYKYSIVDPAAMNGSTSAFAACLLNGYSESYYDAGEAITVNLMGSGQPDVCAGQIASLFSFGNLNVSSLTAGIQFYGLEGLSDISAILSKSVNVSVNDIVSAGRQYCGTFYNGTQNIQNCFNAFYYAAILRDGFGFAATSPIFQLQSTINGNTVAWPLGCALYDNNLLQFQASTTTGHFSWADEFKNFDWAGHILAVFFGVLLLLLFVFVVVNACVNDYKRLKAQQPSTA